MFNNFRNKNKNNSPDGINLGDLVRDRITGFEGVVECISEWLNSCRRITITPVTLNKDGNFRNSKTIDAPQIEIVEKGFFDKPKIKKGGKTGGPSLEPVRHD